MNRITIAFAVVALSAVAAPRPASALPPGPTVLCETYPDSAMCASTPACTVCHTTPPARNDFGRDVEAELLVGTPRPLTDMQYSGGLPAALAAVENLDSDGDGYSNLAEIVAGTFPGDPMSRPAEATCPEPGMNPSYAVCEYDPRYALKKVSLDFCGVSPTFEELQAFDAMGPQNQLAAVSSKLDECLDSEYWLGKDGALWTLANAKIRPLQAIKSGADSGALPLSDYYDDYNLFVYTQTDDRDARDVLTADYFVIRTGTSYTEAQSGVQQFVARDRRAGMLTTNWNLIYNIMFTAVPRTAAAVAYRSYLGFDIARMEGLSSEWRSPDELVDYDLKGIRQAECAGCHEVLDPLTYPFTRYQGLTGSFGTYDSNRLADFRFVSPDIEDTPEAGWLFGQRVDDLVEWGQVAANSPEFGRATVADYWEMLMTRAPEGDELGAFETLVSDFMGANGYRIEAMLHDFVLTEAYGAP